MLVVAIAASFLLVGCSGGDGGDPNYSKNIEMTDEQKAREAEEIKHRPPPGSNEQRVGVPRAEPQGGVKMPPGKH